MATYHTGDTIRVAATFRDWSSDGTGALIDPDTVEVTVFDADDWSVVTGPIGAVNESVGVWYYDWIFPDSDPYPFRKSYYIEYEGMKDSLPIVKRLRVTATQVGTE